jgi:hypothetical protein
MISCSSTKKSRVLLNYEYSIHLIVFIYIEVSVFAIVNAPFFSIIALSEACLRHKPIFISEKATKGVDIPVTGRCMVVIDKIT